MNFLEEQIPSFVPHTDNIRALVAQQRDSRAKARVTDIHLGSMTDAVLVIEDTAAASFAFELRSRVNARLLSGGPIVHNGDIAAAAAALIDRCKKEASFRIDHTPSGNIVKLLDEKGQELGRSAAISSEAMTLATLKLIATQAGCARVLRRS